MILLTLPIDNTTCQVGDVWKEQSAGAWYSATGRMRDLITGATDHSNILYLSEETITTHFGPTNG